MIITSGVGGVGFPQRAMIIFGASVLSRSHPGNGTIIRAMMLTVISNTVKTITLVFHILRFIENQ
jgi:hypothetical protein